ncbi:hypothetical protein SLEP1_g44801 [Rubroshorea leprosula]|uniref:Uncharacterized protein n=1 Tax=Rubroshorea leprosula TaxID=152421 RepID=A0AAV5LIP0_9ROSI|nr:hypothetical protein SLEP1_g44801 [Rubroshorea leprosula]
MDLTSAQCIEAAKLYGPSTLSEAEMDKFLGAAGGAAIPKKPRKKSRTSTNQVDGGGVEKEVVPSIAIEVEEDEPELQLKRKSMEEREALQKKKKVMEEEGRGSELEGAEVRAPRKRKGLVPPLSCQSSLFEAKNMTGARRFINSTFPEVDKCQARDEALRISESEREAQAKEITLMKDAFMELKENVQVKKVKAEYPEVDITKITFGEQEEGVEENGESMSADFHPQIKLRWEHDADGRAVFPPQFDFEFVAVEEEGAEVEEEEVEARGEGAEVDESQPIPKVEIHPVPFDDKQPPLPDEQQPTQPPLPAEQELVEPPPPVEK